MTQQHNIVIFGEAGCGKSSLVNMIVGENVAKVSSELLGCTFRSEAYDATFDNTHFRIYDTAGLNEGDQGRVPHWTSVRELYTLIRKLDSVSLLIYCIRGRVKENTQANWILFNKVICGEQVPAVVVVTGLENDRDWDDRSKMKKFRTTFEAYDIKPEEITSVVSIKGNRNEFAKHYDKSQQKLRQMITKCRRKEPWSRAKEDWFVSIYHTTYTTQLCFFSRTNVEFNDKMRTVIHEFTQATSMSEAESKELQDTLLRAEKKVMEEKEKEG